MCIRDSSKTVFVLPAVRFCPMLFALRCRRKTTRTHRQFLGPPFQGRKPSHFCRLVCQGHRQDMPYLSLMLALGCRSSMSADVVGRQNDNRHCSPICWLTLTGAAILQQLDCKGEGLIGLSSIMLSLSSSQQSR